MKAFTGQRPTPDEFRRWRAYAMADFSRPGMVGPNKRAAKCRVCGTDLPAGEGVGYVEFLADGYRCCDRYVCHDCATSTTPNM